MMNRRQFVYAAAAGVVTFARGSELLAAEYDLIIRGGRAIDPSLRVNATRDVAITGGRIAAVEADIAADAAEVIDAAGKVVVPGLLDVHTHYARDEEGPLVGLAGGVTGWVDAGSAGADDIDDMVAIAKSAPQPAGLLINIGRAGILPDGDTMDLRLADVGAAREAVARNRDVVMGVKARLTRGVAADDVEVVATRAGGGRVFQPAGNDPHGPNGLATSQAARPAQARRRRHPHVLRRRRTASSTTTITSCRTCSPLADVACGSMSPTDGRGIYGGTPSMPSSRRAFGQIPSPPMGARRAGPRKASSISPTCCPSS